MTDSTGTIAETLDYFPFGQIRLDNKTSSFTEQRKYIGQEFDADTGLNYLNARYYNSTIGRFTVQDPVALVTPEKLLADPQQLNLYSYARNNPIVMSDPSGLKVELISRPIFSAGGYILGSHVFWLMTPDNPNEININGLQSSEKNFTIGGYPNQLTNPITNKLTKQIGTAKTSGDKKTAFEGGKILNRVEVKPLEGQTDSQLINSLGNAYNNINLEGMNYWFLGNREGEYNGNSNNFAYTVGVNAGLKDQMDAFKPNPDAIVGGKAPGYGTILPNTSVFKQIQASISNIAHELKNLIANLNNK